MDTDDDLFLIDGILTELHVEVGRQNLMEKIDAHYRSNSVISGIGAAVGDMFGQAASAASLAMHDGEDTQNFACLVGDRVVFGQFAGAEFLKAGSRVKAVVSRRGAVLSAGAILDEAQGYLWMGHAWGGRAEAMGNIKLGLLIYLFSMVCFATATAFIGTGSWTYWEALAKVAVGTACIFLIVAFWSARSMRALTDPSTEMFKLLRFTDPARVNLNRYRVSIVHFADMNLSPSGVPFARLADSQKRDVFCYKLAIQQGRLAIAA